MADAVIMDKRMQKLGAAARELRPPKRYGPDQADLTLVCWGSACGPCREAVDLINSDGGSANLIHFSDLWPFPAEETASMLDACRRTVAVEQNYTSQLARLIRMSTGRSQTPISTVRPSSAGHCPAWTRQGCATRPWEGSISSRPTPRGGGQALPVRLLRTQDMSRQEPARGFGP